MPRIALFNDDRDREDFIERLSTLLPETKSECYAWSFLSNHTHFFIKKRTGGYRLAHEKTAKAMDYQLEASDI